MTLQNIFTPASNSNLNNSQTGFGAVIFPFYGHLDTTLAAVFFEKFSPTGKISGIRTYSLLLSAVFFAAGTALMILDEMFGIASVAIDFLVEVFCAGSFE